MKCSIFIKSTEEKNDIIGASLPKRANTAMAQHLQTAGSCRDNVMTGNSVIYIYIYHSASAVAVAEKLYHHITVQ